MNNPNISISCLMAVLSAGVLSAETYYYVGENSTKFESPDSWSTTPDGLTAATSAPTASTDVVIGSAAAKTSFEMSYSGTSMGSLTLASDYAGDLFRIAGWNGNPANQPFRIAGDLNAEEYSEGTARTFQMASQIDTEPEVGMGMYIGGNINAQSGNTIKLGSQETKWNGQLSGYVEVGTAGVAGSGNINVTAGANNASVRFGAAGPVNSAAAGIDNPNVLVRGVVNLSSTGAGKASIVMYSGGYYTAAAEKRSTFVKVGGVSGKGIIYGDTASTYISGEAYPIQTSLVFANSGVSTFEGNIAKIWTEKTDRRGQDVSVNLVMEGTGTQVIKGGDVVEVTSVEVRSGRLDLSNPSGTTYGAISLDGGTLGVAGTSSSGIGELNAESIAWNGGSIAIDISGNSADMFHVVDFKKGLAENFVFDFNIIGDVFEDTKYLIGVVDGEFGFDAAKDFSFSANGYLVDFEWAADELSLYATFTQIPEPASVAAALGVIALGLAAGLGGRRR